MALLAFFIAWVALSIACAALYGVYRINSQDRPIQIEEGAYGYCMCGGCGRTVPLLSDGFSVADHNCLASHLN